MPHPRRRIEETIHDLRRDVTVVIVTHHMRQAARVSQTCAFFLAEQLSGPGDWSRRGRGAIRG